MKPCEGTSTNICVNTLLSVSWLCGLANILRKDFMVKNCLLAPVLDKTSSVIGEQCMQAGRGMGRSATNHTSALVGIKLRTSARVVGLGGQGSNTCRPS